MNIIWSNEAKITYEQIIDDLIAKWNLEIVLLFESKTNKLLDNLKFNNKLCPKSSYKNLRKCVINKNVSLIYKLNKRNIEIVTFIFNRDNHGFYLEF